MYHELVHVISLLQSKKQRQKIKPVKMKNIQVHMVSLTKHNCRSHILHPFWVRVALKGCWADHPLWLVAPITSLSPPSLCFYGSAHPSQSHSPPQLEVAALGCRPHSRIPWLEALMLLLLLQQQLFQALWCHLKEGPALMPRAWVTTREGERERERDSVRRSI